MSDAGILDLSGRAAVVTGAGSGIGRASAALLGSSGAAVLCADLDEAAATETASVIEATGGRAIALAVDVSRHEEVAAVMETALREFGGLHIACNIAGVMHESAVVDTEESDLDRVLGVNLKGVFFGCQEAARHMVSVKSGSIVNMVSSAIDAPAPGIGTYAMSKAAVAQLTRTLAVEVGRSGVRVNAVAPGFVVTGMTSRHFRLDDGSMDETKRAAVVGMMGKMAPLGRVGEPEDIARTVLFLASDASSFVTGQVIRVNGGVSMA